mmetsp:Transcript_27801/g.50510  ORF Transcript_27801/g.50510 Transcript_27801/m.50510 type:complete len:80 (+) Transcript_27801:100-339(+)
MEATALIDRGAALPSSTGLSNADLIVKFGADSIKKLEINGLSRCGFFLRFKPFSPFGNWMAGCGGIAGSHHHHRSCRLE